MKNLQLHVWTSLVSLLFHGCIDAERYEYDNGYATRIATSKPFQRYEGPVSFPRKRTVTESLLEDIEKISDPRLETYASEGYIRGKNYQTMQIKNILRKIVNILEKLPQNGHDLPSKQWLQNIPGANRNDRTGVSKYHNGQELRAKSPAFVQGNNRLPIGKQEIGGQRKKHDDSSDSSESNTIPDSSGTEITREKETKPLHNSNRPSSRKSYPSRRPSKHLRQVSTKRRFGRPPPRQAKRSTSKKSEESSTDPTELSSENEIISTQRLEKPPITDKGKVKKMPNKLVTKPENIMASASKKSESMTTEENVTQPKKKTATKSNKTTTIPPKKNFTTPAKKNASPPAKKNASTPAKKSATTPAKKKTPASSTKNEVTPEMNKGRSLPKTNAPTSDKKSALTKENERVRSLLKTNASTTEKKKGRSLPKKNSSTSGKKGTSTTRVQSLSKTNASSKEKKKGRPLPKTNSSTQIKKKEATPLKNKSSMPEQERSSTLEQEKSSTIENKKLSMSEQKKSPMQMKKTKRITMSGKVQSSMSENKIITSPEEEKCNSTKQENKQTSRSDNGASTLLAIALTTLKPALNGETTLVVSTLENSSRSIHLIGGRGFRQIQRVSTTEGTTDSSISSSTSSPSMSTSTTSTSSPSTSTSLTSPPSMSTSTSSPSTSTSSTSPPSMSTSTSYTSSTSSIDEVPASIFEPFCPSLPSNNETTVADNAWNRGDFFLRVEESKKCLDYRYPDWIYLNECNETNSSWELVLPEWAPEPGWVTVTEGSNCLGRVGEEEDLLVEASPCTFRNARQLWKVEPLEHASLLVRLVENEACRCLTGDEESGAIFISECEINVPEQYWTIIYSPPK